MSKSISGVRYAAYHNGAAAERKRTGRAGETLSRLLSSHALKYLILRLNLFDVGAVIPRFEAYGNPFAAFGVMTPLLPIEAREILCYNEGKERG